MLAYGGTPDILLVDDVAANLRVLAEMLKEDGYRTRSALNGEAALRAAEADPPDLVLLDVMMPGMDGYETCRRLKELPGLSAVPVVFLSALDDPADKVKAFSSGGVDFVTKPFHLEEVRARVNTHLRIHQLQNEVEEYSHKLESLVIEQIQEITDSQMATIYALARLAESRDDETGTHLARVRSFCRVLAEGVGRLGVRPGIDRAFVNNIAHASLLHDIGKVAIRDDILLKPGKLTAEEFEVMKSHTTLGAETLEAVRDEYPRNEFIAMGIHVVRSHHERWDGSGYPDGLHGEQIPLSARIMAVADVYDALRSKRVYKDAIGHEEACDIIFSGAGTQFDPAVIEAFELAKDEFGRIVAEKSA